MIYQLIVALALAATVSTKPTLLYQEDSDYLQTMWESFKLDYHRVYPTAEEEADRFKKFVVNLMAVDKRGSVEAAVSGQATFGITRFSDLSQAEFETRYLTADPMIRSSVRASSASVAFDYSSVSSSVNTALPLVDWTGVYTTPVKDQGYCGACWAFSATEQIESDAMRVLKKTFVLSPEQITECDLSSYDCHGGATETAYNYVTIAGGLQLESTYPYTAGLGVAGTCHADPTKFVVSVSKFTPIVGEANMATHVQTTGPLSVCVDATVWNSYSSGILTTCGSYVNHCVQAVGVFASPVGGFWKVRNSWGTNWGEAGFIRLAYGANTCAIATDPTFATVALKT